MSFTEIHLDFMVEPLGKEGLLQWLDLFRNKQSNQLNAMTGIVISFVFGIVTFSTNPATATILAYISFTTLIMFIFLFFYRRFKYYCLKEKIVLFQAKLYYPSDLVKFRNELTPRRSLYWLDQEWFRKYGRNLKISKTQRIFMFFAPRSITECVLQCILWGSFVIVLILWPNPTMSYFISSVGANSIVQVLNEFAYSIARIFIELFQATDLEYGPRHEFFSLFGLLSTVVLILGHTFDKRIEKHPLTETEIKKYNEILSNMTLFTKDEFIQKMIGIDSSNEKRKEKEYIEIHNFFLGMVNSQILELEADNKYSIRKKNRDSFYKNYYILQSITNLHYWMNVLFRWLKISKYLKKLTAWEKDGNKKV